MNCWRAVVNTVMNIRVSFNIVTIVRKNKIYTRVEFERLSVYTQAHSITAELNFVRL
jgi:hypothetical protein